VRLDLAVNAHFARSTRADMRVTAAVREFNAHGSIHREGFIERAFGAGLRPASSQQQSCASRQRNPTEFA